MPALSTKDDVAAAIHEELGAAVFAVRGADRDTFHRQVDGVLARRPTLLVVIGFGWCGRGLAARARGMGARVVVCEVDPRRALEAVMEGYQVLPVAEAARVGEVSVTVTGNRTQALAVERLATAADPPAGRAPGPGRGGGRQTA